MNLGGSPPYISSLSSPISILSPAKSEMLKLTYSKQKNLFAKWPFTLLVQVEENVLLCVLLAQIKKMLFLKHNNPLFHN